MDTFSSDSIRNQTGMVASNARTFSRNIEIPIKIVNKKKIGSKQKKQIKEISNLILKLAETLNKVA